MKATFEITSWLSENRNTIIAKHEELKAEKFYNGISLKDFMVQILNAMTRNNVKSAKRAESMLSFLMGDIYFNNSKVVAEDKVTDALKDKHNGTAFMAMV
jgi:hypothetical protein